MHEPSEELNRANNIIQGAFEWQDHDAVIEQFEALAASFPSQTVLSPILSEPSEKSDSDHGNGAALPQLINTKQKSSPKKKRNEVTDYSELLKELKRAKYSPQMLSRVIESYRKLNEHAKEK